MKNKVFAVIIVLCLLIIVVHFYTQDDNASKLVEVEKELDIAKGKITELQQQNAQLKEDKEQAELELEDMLTTMVQSDKIIELLPNPELTEILHKDVKKDRIELVYEDDSVINIGVYRKDNKISGNITIDEKNPEEDVTIRVVDYGNGEWMYGGMIKNKSIENVYLSGEEAEIIPINEELQVWYKIFENWDNSKNNNLTVEAVDDEGEVLFPK